MNHSRVARTVFGLVLCACVAAPYNVSCYAKPSSGRMAVQSTGTRPPVKQYHIANYKLAVRFDQDKQEVFGDETLTVRAIQANTHKIYLNNAELTMDAVDLERADGRRVPLSHAQRGNQLWISLKRAPGSRSSLKLHIVYHGFPRAGLFFVHPTADYPDAPREIYSQGEPDFNEHWFPCWDAPDDMATSELIATVPQGQVAVSNGRLVSEQHTTGYTTFDWVESVPHSSYLISIAVGPWKKVLDSGVKTPVEYYVPSYVDEATARRSFWQTPDMIRFFSNATGVEYPYEKYAQTTVHDFPFGGQENVSATTLAETTLHTEQADVDYPSTGLVSHELGQQWCGDYVQARDWANIWLNEGCATFLDALYTQHRAGTDEYRYEIYNDQLTEQAEERAGRMRPIVDHHFHDPIEMFDEITHEKGAAVLDMLRFVLDGQEIALQVASPEEPMLRGLHRYLVEYRTQSVGTHQLLVSMEKATGKKLDWFFQEWVYQAGHPDYQVQASYDPQTKVERLSVVQTQRRDALIPIFDMPITLVFYGADGVRKQVDIRDSRRQQEFLVSLDFRPHWIDFDPYGVIDKTLQFSQPVESMGEAALHDPSTIARLWAVQQLGMAEAPPADVQLEALTQVLAHDSFYGVRVAAAESLGKLKDARAKGVLLNSLHQADNRVRAAVVQALGRYADDGSVYATLTEELQKDPSYAVRAAAATQIGESGKADAVDVLNAALAQKPEAHVTLALLDALAITHNTRATEILLTLSEPGTPKRFRLRALAALADARACGPLGEHPKIVNAALHDPFFPIQEAGEDLVGVCRMKQDEHYLEDEARSGPTKMQRSAAIQNLRRLRASSGFDSAGN